ncbi:hypothetical protein CHS0354_031356 [Potamilus streckersoni]|uniref:Claudin n=1 Tax=Potamilus streckersoni TaxID=2493646 RepID=A0AAE0VX29_9BIVA|nr:hypothetical protein CHS0354_031356 [Potamilus streckersoni]
MLKIQCLLHFIIALSTCLMLGGLLVPGYVTLTIQMQTDTSLNVDLYLGVWYGVACQKSNCDVFFSGDVTQKAVNWGKLSNIHWEKIPFVDKWTAFASLITIACGLYCIAAVIFTKRRCCNHDSSSPQRAELIAIAVLLGLNVCLTFVTLMLYFNQYPVELPSTVKEKFQVALLLSSLGSTGAMTAVVLSILLIFKSANGRQQSCSSHISQEETSIPMAASAIAPTNQNDVNSLQSGDTHLRNSQSVDNITTEASGTYQLPLEPFSENHKLEPSAPPPPWWWNP